MKLLILIVLLLGMSSASFAQTNVGSFQKAKVYLKDYSVLKVKRLEMKDTEVTFLNKANQKSQNIMLSEVDFIKVSKGSRWLEGTLYGATVGALTGVLVDIDTDVLGNPNQVSAAEYIGITVGGAVVGAVIGFLIPKWKNIYSGGKYVGKKSPFELGLSSFNDQTVVKISISL